MWLVVIIYIISGALGHMFKWWKEEYPGDKVSIWGYRIFFPLCLLAGFTLVFYGVGWFWYWVCGGWILWEATTFLEIVGYGLVSLTGLVLFGGIIAMAFGWNPYK